MVSLHSASQILTTLFFLIGIIFAASMTYPDETDEKSRVAISEDGYQYCIECEEPLEGCQCQCPGCKKPFRTIKTDAQPEASLIPEFRLWDVSIENCCQCHLEKGNPHYCEICLLTLKNCPCFSDGKIEDSSSSWDSSPTEKKMKLSLPFEEVFFSYPGSDISSIMPSFFEEPQVVSIFADKLPRLECSDNTGSSSDPFGMAGISDTEGPSGLNQPNLQNQDMLSALFHPNLASQVTPIEDASLLTQVLTELNTSINSNPSDPFDAAFHYLQNQTIPPSGATPVQESPDLKIILLNDNGVLRALSIISNDQQTLYLFINKSGNVEVYISYAGNDDALSTAMNFSGMYVMVMHFFCALPFQGLEALWSQAIAILENTLIRPANVIKPTLGFTSTARRTEKPVRIEQQPLRESQSQRLARILMANISPSTSLESFTNPVSNLQLLAYNLGVSLTQKIRSRRIEPGTALSSENSQPSEGTDSINILGDQYNFVDEFSSNTWLSSLESDVSLIFVINHHNPFGESPLIIHVTLGTFQDQLILITYSQSSNSPDVSDPIILPSGGFVQALKELIKRISDNYRIRFFEQDEPPETEK